MDTAIRNIQYALRLIVRNPGFSLVSIVVLGVGIAATTAIFSVLYSVVLKPLPFDEPDELVWVWYPRPERLRAVFSIPDYRDFQGRNTTLARFEALTPWNVVVTGADEPDRLVGLLATPGAFATLGSQPAAGRLLRDDDAAGSDTRVAVLSWPYWQSRFGGSREVVGKSLTLNGQPHTVVGVMRKGDYFPGAGAEVAIVAPLLLSQHAARDDRDSNFLRAFGRLKPGRSVEQAESDLRAIAIDLQKQYPRSNAVKLPPRVFPLKEELFGDYRTPLLLILAAVGLVLLLACLNFSSLLLARGILRTREFAIRAALGATTIRLVNQSLTESGTIAFLGCIVGIALSPVAIEAIGRVAGSSLPNTQPLELSATSLAFAIAVTAGAGLIAGILPAYAIARANLEQRLREASRTSTAGRRQILWVRALVAVEIAIALVLLAAAVVVFQSIYRLERMDPGFDPEGLQFIRMSLPVNRYSQPRDLERYFKDLAGRVQAIPGVESVALASIPPMLNILSRTTFTIAERPPGSLSEVPSAFLRHVSGNYHAALKTPIVQGRDILPSDTVDSARVVVVNEAFAARHFPGTPPVGKRLTIEGESIEIVGVARDLKIERLDERAAPMIFVPFTQVFATGYPFLASRFFLVLRTRFSPAAAFTEVRRHGRAIDADVPIKSFQPASEAIADSLRLPRFYLALIAGFGTAAAAIAAFGLYGLMAQVVALRSPELALRRVMGARSRQLAGLLLREAGLIVGTGVALGLPLSWLVLAQLRSLRQFPVTPEAGTLVAATIAIMLVSLASLLLPLRSVLRLEPQELLRSS